MEYTPLTLGSEDFFAKAFEIVNEEIERAVKKSAKAFAQKTVTSFGQMPYGSSASQNIMGDIFGSGEKAKGKAYTEIALGAALPQFQAQFQAGESEKQRTFLGEQAELDRQLKEMISKVLYEMGLARAEGSKVPWWQSLLQTGAEALPYL